MSHNRSIMFVQFKNLLKSDDDASTFISYLIIFVFSTFNFTVTDSRVLNVEATSNLINNQSEPAIINQYTVCPRQYICSYCFIKHMNM